ncbi:UNVERIFIED_CONTAM: hypothetical protein K2H54_005324 [Gekko kuhli]
MNGTSAQRAGGFGGSTEEKRSGGETVPALRPPRGSFGFVFLPSTTRSLSSRATIPHPHLPRRIQDPNPVRLETQADPPCRAEPGNLGWLFLTNSDLELQAGGEGRGRGERNVTRINFQEEILGRISEMKTCDVAL